MQAPRKGVCVCVCVKRCLGHAQKGLIGEEMPANEEPAYSEFIYRNKPRGMSRRLLLDEFFHVREYELYRGEFGKP